jgi:hypothetical protein
VDTSCHPKLATSLVADWEVGVEVGVPLATVDRKGVFGPAMGPPFAPLMPEYWRSLLVAVRSWGASPADTTSRRWQGTNSALGVRHSSNARLRYPSHQSAGSLHVEARVVNTAGVPTREGRSTTTRPG